MSSSPTADAPGDRAGYERSWEALNKMLRDGGSLSGRERHCAFVNLDGRSFADVSAVSGLDLADDGRAAARVDWDLDGSLDLWVTNRNGPRLRFLRNRAVDAGRFVALRLEGTACNRDAIGARVTVELPGGRRLADTLRAGEGYLAQSSKWMHFGLADAEAIERVTVRWPGGGEERFEDLAPGGRYVLVQESGVARPWNAPPGEVTLAPSTPAAPPSTERARVILVGRVPLPSIAVEGPEGEPIRLSGRRERPLLIAVWASWCAPCLDELAGFAGAVEELERLGLEVLALDAGEDPGAARAVLDRLAWPHLRGRAGPGSLDVLDLLQRMQLERRRRMPLPTAFLLDTSGRVAAIYKGAVDLDALARDVGGLDDSAEANRAAAVPFEGRWHAAPTSPDLEWLADRFAERGLEGVAREIRVRQYEIRELTQAGMHNEVGLVRARQGKMEDAARHFASAAELEPEWFDAHRNLGSALHELGRLSEAAASYEIALRYRPRDEGTIHNLALAYTLLGEREQAQDLLQLLTALDARLGAELAEQIRVVEAQR